MVALFSRRRRFVWLVLHLLWIMVAVFGCAREEEPPEVIRSIRWTQVVATTTHQVRMISGTTKPVDQTALSFAVSGTVEKVEVKLGDRVKRNQVLAVLDQQPFVLAVRDAEAALSKAQANVVERRANYDRILGLYESNNASKAELDEARASFDSAKSQVNAANAQLGLAKRDLRKTVLRAPFNGSISMKEVEPYVEIRRGRAIFGLDGEESGFEVRAVVPESLVIRLNTGDEAEIIFPTLNNRKVPGVITEIGSRSQTASTFPVTVQLREEFRDLRAGMSVEVAFQFAPEKVTGEPVAEGFIVPLAAILVGAKEQRFVFIYDKETSTVKKIPVEALNLRENDVIVGSELLKSGDIVATAGVQFLAEGQKVNLMKEEK
ncbi:MAG: efflux RND transporter periplasmic adaptor subunit [Deltaproteobacteria bacterium]|nr:MAG: efflux RND transporter periplasmic adaptor subunit [Deltaproteobacteria bacterium]